MLGEGEKHGWGWGRVAARKLDPSRDSLVFQQLDVDYSTVHQNTEPVVRIFGVTAEVPLSLSLFCSSFSSSSSSSPLSLL